MFEMPDNASPVPHPVMGVTRPAAAPAVFSKMLNGWFLAVVALAACWFQFFAELRGEWETNAQYNYGYVVPLLGAALLWRRWQERPGASPGSAVVAGVIASALLFLLLPLRVILEANPEWRLVYWVQGCVVIGLSFCLFYRAGGGTWVKFFAPPLVFMLIAVPWPMGMEQAIIQNLMRLVAGMTVEVAGWLGIPAVQHGNLIEVEAGVIGIDEACSGVRSLQSALMLSLFLGEMHRFSAKRRAFLLIASLVFVLLANVTRTTFLTWAAATRGLPQMQAWHDTAGIVVMLIVVSGLFVLAHLMKPRNTRVPTISPPPAGARVGLSPSVALVAAAWLVAAEAVTEVWYRAHEAGLEPTPRWSVSWPIRNASFKKGSLPENSLAILRCSDSDSASWNDDQGNEWSAFLLRWNPGRNSAQLAKGHRPDICFPAAGARMVDDFGQLTANAGGIEMPFRHESFESGSRTLHVFYCLWSDKISRNEKPLLENGSEASRLQAVLAGKRNLGQQVLEVVVVGPVTSDDAVAAFRRQLSDLVHPG